MSLSLEPRERKETTMDARLNLYDSTMAAKFAKYINSSGAAVTDSTLPAATQELVKIRASQINGCSGCLDMHTKDAEHSGEASVRLHLVAAWREATVFTEAEKAALELTEQGTRPRTVPEYPMKRGPTRPGTTTVSSSARWCA